MSTPSKPSEQSLQQRLEALVDKERKSQELWEELREQRWAAQQHDAARRLEGLEEALELARREIAKREEAEAKLAKVRLEAAKLAVELGAARREVEGARRATQPEPPDEPTSRKRIFAARGRTCAVCRRNEASSPGGLRAAGWALGAEVDLCPECQRDGWELPKSGVLPFRRSSKREEADV
jgi:hypothetical protein